MTAHPFNPRILRIQESVAPLLRFYLESPWSQRRAGLPMASRSISFTSQPPPGSRTSWNGTVAVQPSRAISTTIACRSGWFVTPALEVIRAASCRR